MVLSRSSAVLVWLACTAVLVNPWQAENFWWEFQTPWIFVNALVMLAVLLLSAWIRPCRRIPRRVCLMGGVILPWLAIYSSGQGFALAISLFLCAIILSRKLALLTLSSTIFAAWTYFRVLDYDRLGSVHFEPDFMLRMLAGGAWKGMGVLCLVLAILCIVEVIVIRVRRTRTTWPSIVPLALPALFAIFFMLMTTLSRSPFGIEWADSSRYVTAISLLPVSGLMMCAWLHETAWPPPRAGQRARCLGLLPAAMVLITTTFSFPQVVTRDGLLYEQAWKEAGERREQLERGFRCSAHKAAALIEEHANPVACVATDPAEGEAIKYFTGKKALKPLGWHRRILATPSSPLP